MSSPKKDLAEAKLPSPSAMPTEDEMLKILSKKYKFVPRESCEAAGGARPKHPPPPLLLSSTPDASSIPPFMLPPPTPSIFSKPPKIPLFSGDDPIPKNEVSYYEWRHEVRCLRRDSNLSPSQVLQAIRMSLRGTARRLLVSLGDNVSVDIIINKLDVNFCEPARQGVTMQQFFNTVQRPEESVTSFSCRLESTLEQAFQGGHLPRTSRHELLCERLWSGLYSESLKANTRHKFDAATDYEMFLKDVRQVELELSLTQPGRTKQKATSHQQSISPTASDFAFICKKQSEMESNLSRLQSSWDKKFSSVLQHLEHISLNLDTPPSNPHRSNPPTPSHSQTFSEVRPQRGAQRGRSYGRGRGSQRGGYSQQSYQTTGNNRQGTGYPNF